MENTAIALDLPTPPTALPQRLPRRLRRRHWAAGAALLACAAVVPFFWGPAADELTATVDRIGSLHWGYLPVLAALTLVHYMFAAMTLRAVSEKRLPLGATVMTQFTAASANRIAPGGLGAAAVNTRFLVCSGVRAPRAIAAVAVMQLSGGPADALLFVAVFAVVPGGHDAPAALTRHVSAAVRQVPTPLWPVVAAVVVVAVVWSLRRRRGSGSPGAALSVLAGLLRRPRDLVVMLAASAATTLTLGVAFVFSVLAVPGAASPRDAGALLAAYLIGAAAAGVLPLPSSVGSTEAALIGVLGTAHVPTGQALQAVLLFRVVTYWLPVPVGLLTTRPLRRRQERRAAAEPEPEPELAAVTP